MNIKEKAAFVLFQFTTVTICKHQDPGMLEDIFLNVFALKSVFHYCILQYLNFKNNL